MLGDSLSELAFTNDGRSKNGISSSDTSSTAETVKPIEWRDKSPDEQTGNKPSECHDGDEEQGNRSPVTLHVELWQFDTNGKTLHNQNDTGELQSDTVLVSPCAGVDKVGCMWAKDDTTDGSDCSLADV